MQTQMKMQTQGNIRVNYSHLNANANASARADARNGKKSFSCACICASFCISHVWTIAHSTQMQTQVQGPTQEMEKKHFLALAFALPFAFHTCEAGQRKSKCKRKAKQTLPVSSISEDWTTCCMCFTAAPAMSTTLSTIKLPSVSAFETKIWYWYDM